jgi:hypothetical protein
MKILQTPGRVYPYIGSVVVLGVSVMIFQGGMVMRKKASHQSTSSTEGDGL